MDLQTRVDAVREARISPSTRKLYRGSMTKFLLWLYENNRDLLDPRFLEGIPDGQSLTKDYIRQVLGPPAILDRRPIQFDAITANDFLLWIVSMRKSDDTELGSSALSTHRSAFFNLFKDFRETMPSEVSEELATSFQGIKRDRAKQLQQGLISLVHH